MSQVSLTKERGKRIVPWGHNCKQHTWEGFHHHMLLEDCTNIVVGTNLFDFSPNIERNTVPRNSLKLTRCEQCTLNGLHIVHAIDEAGLVIEDSKRLNIANCSILDCQNVGLLLRNVTQSIITGCLIKSTGEVSFIPVHSWGPFKPHWQQPGGLNPLSGTFRPSLDRFEFRNCL